MRSVFPTARWICACVSLVACSAESPPEEIVRPVISIVVADIDSFRRNTFPGRAKAQEEVDLAFEVPGRLIERPVKVGDQLQKGDLVAQLDARDYQNALDRALADQGQARSYLERIEQAVVTGAVSRQELDDARARAEAAAAQVRIRRKAVEDAGLVAPFDGTVAATYVENFQNVLAKQTIVRLLDTSRIEMIVSVPESLIALAPLAYDIEVEFDAYPGRKLPAEITEISNEASRATRTYPVTVVFDPPDDMDIKPGMAATLTAQADLPAAAREAGIEIPLSALYSPPDDPGKKTYVWIVDPEALQVEVREIEVSRLTPRGARVRGLEPGDRVVTVGVHYLAEGQKVTLAEASGRQP